ncbi:hypothetical protein CLOM_g24178 [Closterium sp. NIES-68]|nr:hypothetical protein CLOM_g24178 [Closterium sp. NIES-68]
MFLLNFLRWFILCRLGVLRKPRKCWAFIFACGIFVRLQVQQAFCIVFSRGDVVAEMYIIVLLNGLPRSDSFLPRQY